MSELALRRIAENKKTKAQSLDLGNCGLTEVPKEVGELVWLEELTFNNNSHLIDISPISDLIGLKHLSFASTSIFDLTPLAKLNLLNHINCKDTKVSNIEPLMQLIMKGVLVLSDRFKGVLAINEENFFNSKDEFDGIHFMFRGDDFSLMVKSDKKIDKQKCKVIYFPWIEKVNFQSPIKYNIGMITTIRNSYPQSHKCLLIDSFVDITDCPLTTPPIEIVQQGNAAILQYFAAKEKQGTNILTEAKIVIVGAGESGKTTLVQKLLNPKHPIPNPDDKRTEGVRVTRYPMQNDLTAHLWDFGGQELYHATHQFFLTPDTLYLLLNDNRKNDTDFYYWLNILALRAGDKCPILTIFNAKDGAPRQIVPDETLFQHFPGLLREAVDVDFADKDLRRFNALKDRIEQHFAALPVLGKPFPAFWVRVREALARCVEEHISWAQFRDICRTEQIEEEAEMRTIAQTLHNLGVLLWFPEVFGLDDLLVLQPQWCIDAVYKALDTQTVKDNFGQFSEADLHTIWRDERYRSQSNRLLKLMQHFDLCYPIEGSVGAFIAPQLLDVQLNPDLNFSAAGGITHRFQYKFMPAGLLTRFIARMSRHIHAPHVWRTGVVLRWSDGTLAEVTENQFGKEITLRVAGPERKRRLNEMRQNLESIHSGFRGLKYEEKVACNCPDCDQSPQPITFTLPMLEDYAQHGDPVVCNNGTRKRIAAQSILDGIEYRDTPRIFISYAPDDRPYVDEFTTMLAPLRKNGDWKVWHEAYLLPGDRFNDVVLRQFSEANVIVLLLTAKFFDSDDKWDIEMSRAIERHQQGNALVIGVVVSPCMWEETPFRLVQMLPRDGTVDSVGNRDGVWKEVVVRIKEAIGAREGRDAFKPINVSGMQ